MLKATILVAMPQGLLSCPHVRYTSDFYICQSCELFLDHGGHKVFARRTRSNLCTLCVFFLRGLLWLKTSQTLNVMNEVKTMLQSSHWSLF